MFGFFRSQPHYRLGLARYPDGFVAVMLDQHGDVQQRAAGPDWKAMLAQFPLKQCRMVVGLRPIEYNSKVWDLDSRSPQQFSGNASTRLPVLQSGAGAVLPNSVASLA